MSRLDVQFMPGTVDKKLENRVVLISVQVSTQSCFYFRFTEVTSSSILTLRRGL